MGKVNPWFEERLKKLRSPPTISVIVEVEEAGRIDEVRAALNTLPGASVGQTSFNMIAVTVPPGLVDQIAALPGVTVHYNAPVGIRANLMPGPPTIEDPLIGQFSLSSVEVPYHPQQMVSQFGPSLVVGLATLPFRLVSQLTGMKAPLSQFHDPSVLILPTGEVLAPLQIPEDNRTYATKVAVLDTGVGYPHPLLSPRKGFPKLGTFAGLAPLDGLGHGTWCVTAAFGGSSRTRFGLCRGVADTQNGTLGSWKVLSDLGFGTTFGIIKGMEAAWKWGAKIVSMSLGGELQGDVDDDPACRIIAKLKGDMIFVVAAGNEGPEEWTIGSPGASPHAVTVGAWSPYYNGLAVFSSRGPNGAWYRDNKGRSHPDFGKYGADMVKPDVVCYGGGPARDGDPMDLIYSGCVGWTDAMYDMTPLDGYGPMRGTSMATPLAAGIIALAYERGMVRTAADVKKKMAKLSPRKSWHSGYGFITFPKLI